MTPFEEEALKMFDEQFTVKSVAGTGILRYTDADKIKSFWLTQLRLARADGQNAERSETGEAMKKLASAFSMNHVTPEMEMTATMYVNAHQEYLKSRYVKQLEQRIIEIESARADERKLTPEEKQKLETYGISIPLRTRQTIVGELQAVSEGRSVVDAWRVISYEIGNVADERKQAYEDGKKQYELGRKHGHEEIVARKA